MGPAQFVAWCSKGDHDWDQGVAIISFPWSWVENISIATYRNESENNVLQPLSPLPNQSVTEGSQPLIDPSVILVEICDRKAGCALCNTVNPKLKLGSNSVVCMNGREGNQIRIIHPGKPIKICDIKIYGKSREDALTFGFQLIFTKCNILEIPT